MRRFLRRSTVALCTLVLLGIVTGTAVSAPIADGTGTSCGSGTSWVPTDVDTTDTTDDVRVIVVYESGSGQSSCAGSAVSAVGGEVVGGQDVDIVPMAVARVDPAAIDALEARPGIASVDRDAAGRAASFTTGENTAAAGSGLADTIPWGIERVNGTDAASLVTADEMGAVDVAVLDSGIDLQHSDLDGNLVWGADFINGNDRVGLEYTDDVLDHGTHVAGTIAAEADGDGVVGMAPNVDLYSIRVLNASNFGYYSWWIKGIDHAVKGPDGQLGTADDAEVLSMSLGGDSDCCGLREAIESASEHAVIVAAAGNDGESTNAIHYPGKYDETLTVAATGKDDLNTDFSSEGPAVDIAAPGSQIMSTVPPEFFNDEYEYAYMGGTSMATPHVSGAAALLIAQDLADGTRDLSPGEIENRLTSTARDIHGPGVDDYSGHGLLRSLAAMQATTVDDPPTAAFQLSPQSPVVDETVTFDASASTDDAGIASYNWTIASQHVNETDPTTAGHFSSVDTYTVSLTVYDTAGQSDTTSQTVTVETDDPPVARLNVSRETPFAGETITLDASNSTDDAGIEWYNFSVGDGPVTSLSTPTAEYTPTSAGTRTLRLTVVDTTGQTNTTNRTISVQADKPPTAVLDVTPEAPMPGDSLEFNASASTDDRGIASYNFSVAGVWINRTTPTVTGFSYNRPGTYTASLTVVDTAGQTNTTSRTITVADDPPTAAFEVTPEQPRPGDSLEFNASASTDDDSIVSYNYSVAGVWINQTSPTVTGFSYNRPGTYTVALTVVDTAGQTNTTTRNITVQADQPPTAALDVTPEEPLPGDSLEFNASASTDERGIVSYNFSVAGIWINQTSPTVTDFTYNRPGTYTVSLTVVDTAGQTNTTTRNITVEPGLTVDAPTVVSPSRNGTGTTVTATVSVGDVVPDGSAEGTLTAEALVDGAVANTTRVNVTDGSTVEIDFEVAPGSVGNYSVSITGAVTINGSTFTDTSETTTLRVVEESATVVTPIDGTTPTDIDDDGRYEDIDGNGDGNIFDALAYYNERENEAIRDNPQFFDFDGDDDSGDLFDALALYNELRR